jgi:TonB family protein
MKESRFVMSGMRLTAVRLFQAAALALVVTLAMPARAADDRAVKSRVAPIYPDIAKRMKVEGMVSVQATVDPNGKVSDAKSVGGNLILAPAAEDAVRKWVFEAGPSTSKVKVDVNFVLAH